MMTTRLSCLVLLLVAVVTVSSSKQLDTDRPPRVFQEPPSAFLRKDGYTYADEVTLDVEADIDGLFGFPLHASLEAVADTQMFVVDIPSMGTIVTLGLANVQVDLNSPIMRVHCDSEHPRHSSPQCEDLLELVGFTETLLLDEDGNPLEVILPDGEVIVLDNDDDDDDDDDSGDDDEDDALALTPYLDKTQQVATKVFPSHALAPGDSWTVDDDFDQVGHFQGTASLDGYMNHKGIDCAVFTAEGTLHLDISYIAQMLGLDPKQAPSMQDAKISKKVVWDYTEGISRWVQVNITTAFDIEDEDYTYTDQPIHVPVDVTFSLATDITGRPDDDDDEASQQQQKTVAASKEMSYAVLAAALENRQHSNNGDVIANNIPIVTLLVIVAALVGMLAMFLYRNNNRYSQYQQLN